MKEIEENGTAGSEEHCAPAPESGEEKAKELTEETAEQAMSEAGQNDVETAGDEEVPEAEEPAEKVQELEDSIPQERPEIDILHTATADLFGLMTGRGEQLVENIRSFLDEKKVAWLALPDPADWGLALVIADLQEQMYRYYELCNASLEEVRKRHAAGSDKEKEATDKALESAKAAAERYEAVFEGMAPLLDHIQQTGVEMEAFEEKMAELPEEVRAPLRERKSAYLLVQKLFSRLPSRRKDVSELLRVPETAEDAGTALTSEIPRAGDLVAPESGEPAEAVAAGLISQIEQAADSMVNASKQAHDAFEGARRKAYETARSLEMAADKIERMTMSFLAEHVIFAIHANERGIAQSEAARKKIPDEYRNDNTVLKHLNAAGQLDTRILDYLDSIGMKRIEVKVGDEFDENLNQALCTVESDDLDEWQIAEISASGYTYNDRVMKPAEVVVVRNAKQESEKKEE